MRDPGQSARRLAVAAALCGAMAGSFPSLVIASSLTEIAADLDTTVTFLGWAISAPLLAGAVALPIVGRLGDLLGHRRVFVTSMSVVMVMAAGISFSWNAASFVTGRVIIQVAGVAIQPAAVALIRGAVSERRRSDAFGAWGFTIAAGPALGLVLGGPLVDAVGWQAPFVLQSAMAGCAVGLGWRAAAASAATALPRFNAAGATCLGLSALGALVALDQGIARGWTDEVTLVALGTAVLGGLGLVRFESRHPNPLVPRRLLDARPFTTAVTSQFFIQAANFGTIALAPVLLRSRFEQSASTTALTSAAMPIAFGVMAPVGGRLSQARGHRLCAVTGTTAMTLSMVALAAAAGARLQLLVAAALLGMGAGAGLCRTGFTVAIAAAGGDQDVGIAIGAERMMGLIGGSLGVAVLLGVAASGDGPAFVSAALVGCGFAACAMIVAVGWIDREQPRVSAASPRA